MTYLKWGGNSLPLKPKERIDYVDLVKGITILWIVWYHSGFYAFGDYRNPIFFFASGVFFKLTDFHTFITKRLRLIVIPLLFFYLASYPYHILLHLWDMRTFEGFEWGSIFQIFDVAPNRDHLSLNAPLWFTITLFVIQTISLLFLRLPKLIIGAVCLLIVLFKDAILAFPTPFMINHACYWIIFFTAGYFIGKPYIEFIKNIKNRVISLIGELTILIVTCVLIGPAGYEDPSHIVSVLSVLSFVMVLLTAFSFFNGNPHLHFLRYFGKNSLIILGMHFWLLTPVTRLYGKFFDVTNPAIVFMIAATVVGCLIPIIEFCNKHIPLLVGTRTPVTPFFAPKQKPQLQN